MNYKAEAKEIVEKFHRIITSQMFGEVDYIHSEIGYLKAKQCALICVDSQETLLMKICVEKTDIRNPILLKEIDPYIDELNEVKQAIKNYD